MASASQATLATENQAAKARIKLINAETNVHIGYVLGMLPQFMCAPKDTTHALVVRMPTVGEKNHMFIVSNDPTLPMKQYMTAVAYQIGGVTPFGIDICTLRGKSVTTGTKYGEASFSNKLWKVSAAPDLEDALEIEAIWDEGIGAGQMVFLADQSQRLPPLFHVQPSGKLCALASGIANPAKTKNHRVRMVLEPTV